MLIECPDQRVPMSRKEEPDWYRNMYDYLISRAISDRDIESVKKRILAANGVIDDEEYKYLVKPINTSGVKFETPGKIREIDFINPIREKAVSSYTQLPYNFQVKVSNPDTTLKRTVQLREAFMDVMQGKFAEYLDNYLKQMQANGQPPDPSAADFEKFKTKFLEEWMDDRAIQGKNIINTINDVNEFEHKRLKAYMYWWMTEEVYTHRTIEGNNVLWEIIPPYECFPIENGEEFVEDYDGMVRMIPMTYVDFMNKLPDLFNKEEMDILKQHIQRHQDGYYHMPYSMLKLFAGGIDATGEAENKETFKLSDAKGEFNLYHMEWKSEREEKELTYLNQLGKQCTMLVEDGYELDKSIGDISLKSIWISEVLHGYKVGNDAHDGIYTKPKSNLVQRRDTNNPRKVKLTYGGKKGIMNDVFINPIPTRLIPYAVYYKIIYLHIERTLAKYQPALKFLPKQLIEGDNDMTRKEKIWYMKADNTMFYDHTEITPMEVSQGVIIKGDPDIANYIQQLIALRISIKQEAWELANMNDEMVGQGDPRGNVTNNQANIAMARLGSVISTRIFNKMLLREHLANLEFSKVAFGDRRSGNFTNKQGDVTYYDIDPDLHNETDYGITMTDADADERMLKEYKEFAFNASQNGNLDIGFEAITDEDVPSIRKTIRKLIQLTKDLEEKKANDANQIQMEQIDRLDKMADKNNTSKETVATITTQGKIEEAVINADTAVLGINAKKEEGAEVDEGMDNEIKSATMRIRERAQSLAEGKANDASRMNAHKIRMDKENLQIKKQAKDKPSK